MPYIKHTRSSYDPKADAMFIWLAPDGAKSGETREVSPGVLLDFDDDGRLIGIEVLDLRSRVAGDAESPVAAVQAPRRQRYRAMRLSASVPDTARP